MDNTKLKDFIAAHMDSDTDKLLLSAAGYPDIDVGYAVGQILIRRQLKDKVPAWYVNPELFFPSRLSAEQCSSQQTAQYKQELIAGKTVCDLSGGLGVDSFYFSRQAEKVFYIERNPEYCKAAEANFKTLGACNIEVIHGDSADTANRPAADTFYIDPDRRTVNNKRLFAIQDCEPNVLEIKDDILKKNKRLIVKLSPMADITETLRLLPEAREVHILAVKNECKELLFVLEQGENCGDIQIHTINYTTNGNKEVFHYPFAEEKTCKNRTTNKVSHYLYEPNAALLKAGAFKLISERFGIEKLHRHSHLYTSEQRLENFPGRSFIVEQCFDFSGKILKELNRQYPKAHVTVRNFILTVQELRKRSKIKDGGDIYLFATTIGEDRKTIIACRKNNSLCT